MVTRLTVRRWAPPFLVATAIFVGSVAPAPSDMGGLGPRFLLSLDKVVHFVGYALLGGTLAAAMEESPPSRGTLALALVALVAVYGAGLEVLQSLLPTRGFSVGDVLANVLGGMLGVWLVLRRRRED